MPHTLKPTSKQPGYVAFLNDGRFVGAERAPTVELAVLPLTAELTRKIRQGVVKLDAFRMPASYGSRDAALHRFIDPMKAGDAVRRKGRKAGAFAIVAL